MFNPKRNNPLLTPPFPLPCEKRAYKTVTKL